MEIENQPVDKDDSAENCDELDDDFFKSIGQTFDVVDSWDDPDEPASGDQVPKPFIKKESEDPVKKEPRNSRDRSSSSTATKRDGDGDRNSKNRDDTNRDPRTRPRNPRRPERIFKSRFNRPSPPAFRRNSPVRGRNSPPRRRNSPPRGRNQGRTSFFEEIVSQFPELRNQNNQQMPFNPNPYAMMQMQQQPPMNFVPDQMNFMGGQPNFMPQMMPDSNPFAPPQFPNVNPMMMAPAPVPAPIEIPAAPLIANPIAKKPAAKKLDLQQIKAKAFKNGEIGLTEYLIQVSNQTSKKASMSDVKVKKTKVLEACKDAVKIIEEINANKPRLPFTLCPMKKPKENSSLSKRSPLVVSDTNMLFLAQSKLLNCRDALEANPLQNISGKYFTLCRNAGLDLNDVSDKVQQKIAVEREKSVQLVKTVNISSNVVDATKKKIHRSAQTDTLECRKCEERAMKDEEPGNFFIRLDAQTVLDLTREQEGALAELCRVFNIADDRFKPMVRNSQWDSDEEERQKPPRDTDDRFSYVNAENPNPIDDENFISFSPVRRSPSPQRSLSRSPRRRRIADRLGAKIPSPRLPRNRDDIDRLVNPTAPYRIPTPPRHVDRGFGFNGNRNRSRSVSPQRIREKRPREDRSKTPDRAMRRGRY